MIDSEPSDIPKTDIAEDLIIRSELVGLYNLAEQIRIEANRKGIPRFDSNEAKRYGVVVEPDLADTERFLLNLNPIPFVPTDPLIEIEERFRVTFIGLSRGVLGQQNDYVLMLLANDIKIDPDSEQPLFYNFYWDGSGNFKNVREEPEAKVASASESPGSKQATLAEVRIMGSALMTLKRRVDSIPELQVA